MIYDRCPRCHKRIPAGSKCDCIKQRHKEYDRYSRNKDATAFYHSKEWQAIRTYILQHYENLDMYELHVNQRIIIADTVHHIVCLQDDKSQGLNAKNLIPVSSATHNMIHNEYNKGEDEKRKMQAILYQCLEH